MTLFELWFSHGVCLVVGLLGHMVVQFLVGLLFVAVRGLLITMASLVAEYGL